MPTLLCMCRRYWIFLIKNLCNINNIRIIINNNYAYYNRNSIGVKLIVSAKKFIKIDIFLTLLGICFPLIQATENIRYGR